MQTLSENKRTHTHIRADVRLFSVHTPSDCMPYKLPFAHQVLDITTIIMYLLIVLHIILDLKSTSIKITIMILVHEPNGLIEYTMMTSVSFFSLTNSIKITVHI